LRRGGALLCCGCLVFAGWLVCAGDAWGSVGHPFVSSVTEGLPGSGLVAPGAVGIDRASGRVFVADAGAGMVAVCSSAGVCVGQLGEGRALAAGLAVDEGTGEVYVADSFLNAVLVFKPDGAGGYVLMSEWSGEALPGEGFGAVAGVAVDNSH